MKNKTFYSLAVNYVAYGMFEKLNFNDKLKVQMLLESEFVYLVNCLISEKHENSFVFAYQWLKETEKERKEIFSK